MTSKTDRIVCTLVGTGAVRFNPQRGGPAQVVEVGGRAMLVDCGRCAVHGVVQCGYEVEDVDSVFVTHLHFDHVCDLPYFVLLAWNNNSHNQLGVFGPTGTRHFLDHAIHQAYQEDIASRLGHGKDASGLHPQVTELDSAGVCLDEEGCVVSSLVTQHAGLLNLNYRFDAGGRRVVVTSDTLPDPGLVEFCQDADLLVCECSGTAEFLANQPWGGWHMNPQTVGELAAKANVKQVVLKHFVIENFSDDPEIAEKMARDVRAIYDGEVAVGIDGLRVEV